MPHTVYVQSSSPAYATEITVGAHHLLADEPADVGGADTGPSPREILLSALGACTSITLRMYAERKQWPLEEVQVQLSYGEGGATKETTVIEREIKLTGPLDEAQRARLLQIANACPLHKILTGAVEIPTKLVT